MAKLADGTPLPGRLFVVEGIDGSGKSTQLDLLRKSLIARGYCVAFSEWNSSPLVRDTIKRGKKTKILTPTTFSLLHAADFVYRMEQQMIPALKAGAIVLADRYIYTAYARDVARGVDPEWVREVYALAVVPTVALYFRVPLEESLRRIQRRVGLRLHRRADRAQFGALPAALWADPQVLRECGRLCGIERAIDVRGKELRVRMPHVARPVPLAVAVSDNNAHS